MLEKEHIKIIIRRTLRFAVVILYLWDKLIWGGRKMRYRRNTRQLGGKS